MRPLLALMFIIFAALPAMGQGVSTIRFPVFKQPIAPIPGTVSKLYAEQLYVIDADIPVLVLASPKGIVTITEEVGHLRIRGRFADGTDYETRTFKGKQIFIVEAIGTGTVDLVVVPLGEKTKESDVLRKTIDVAAGVGPRPPPVPPDQPTPPDPPPSPSPIPLVGLRVIFVIEETIPLQSADQRAILYGKPMRDWLDQKCVVGTNGKNREWRIWDKDVPTQGADKHWQDVMNRPRKSVPWIVISNHPRGGYEGPLPATVEETKALIQKYMN